MGSPARQRNNVENDSPAVSIEAKLDELRNLQQEIKLIDKTSSSGSARCPRNDDFSPSLFTKILEPHKWPVENCILLIHDAGENADLMNSLAIKLRESVPQSSLVILPVPPSSPLGNGQPGSVKSREDTERRSKFATSIILKDVIKACLIEKCRYQTRKIVIIGYLDGGTSALAAAALWNCIQLGGVISVGGLLPAYIQLRSSLKSKTPVLILGDPSTKINSGELERTKTSFAYVELPLRYSSPTESLISSGDRPDSSWRRSDPILGFLMHLFGEKEWRKQAIISFDGGGIRGYGSLLILRSLMDGIADEERRLDHNTESSFSPCEYKCLSKKPIDKPAGRDPQAFTDAIISTSTKDLPNSSLFLPCHYFTYAAGTSTGGLISIMLSRLRMSVHDCLQEYEALGRKIFGNPRPLPNKGVLWDRFNHRNLEEAVKEVVHKYQGGSSDFDLHFAMDRGDEDLIQCIVLAFSSIGNTDVPFLFRTFSMPQTTPDLERSSSHEFPSRNVGDAHKVPIWQVARATSAAPGYFKPMTMSHRGEATAQFKDGGFGTNNPSHEAYNDVYRKHEYSTENMGPFVSIGTGEKHVNKFVQSGPFKRVRDAVNNAKAAIHMASMTTDAHELMRMRASTDKVEQFPYYRFNGGERLGKIGLGDWKSHHFTTLTRESKKSGSKTLEEIQKIIEEYLKDDKVQADLRECAEILVERRRRRSRNASDWDRYASYSYYNCKLKDCRKRQYNTIEDFKKHLQEQHNSTPDDLLDADFSAHRQLYWARG